MISKEVIKNIIEEAIHAPSGDNSQPWKFRVEENKIDIFGIPGRDATLYNFEHRGDLIAHGAIIENICIIAKDMGYVVVIKVLPNKSDETHTATIEIRESDSGDIVKTEAVKKLRENIERRSTNRKPYRKEALTDEQKTQLHMATQEVDGGEVRILGERGVIDAIAKIASVNERLLLENKHIHDFLFSIIRWNDKEELERPGMHIKTFELAPPAQFMFSILKSWKAVRILRKVGISKFIANENAKIYTSSGAILAIAMDNDNRESFVNAGRIFQRIWLTLTTMGLSLQPLAAIPYLAQRVAAGATEELSTSQVDIIRMADKELRKNLEIPTKSIMMLARVGKGDAPTAQAIKISPIIEWVV